MNKVAETTARSPLPLEEWLDSARRPQDEVWLGGTGHLLLSAAEEQNVRRHLQHGVLPRLFGSEPPRQVCLLTGLAPGADITLVRATQAWLSKQGIAHRTVCLMAVPVEHLILDWAAKTEGVDATLSGEERRACQDEIESLISACNEVVDLLPPDAGEHHLGERSFRQNQYRRLAAVLALQTDVLVAVLREQNAHGPGGTAEVVEWRRHPRRVPPGLIPEAVQSQRPPRSTLVVINPTLSYTESIAEQAHHSAHILHGDDEISQYLARCKDALRRGNYLLCYDLALRARRQGLESLELSFIELQALANAGSAGLAQRRLQELALRDEDKSEAWWALEGRIHKDLAAWHSRGWKRSFQSAAQAYFTAYARSGGYFGAINAATMHLMAGDTKPARMLATEVLTRVGQAQPKDESDLYYLLVTEAEACLILRREADCASCLDAANELLRDNLNARSRTVRQIRLLCTRLGYPETLARRLTLPSVLILQRSAPLLRDTSTVPALITGQGQLPLIEAGDFVFCALQDPLDLLAAEAFLNQQARLHVVLAAEAQPLLQQWETRFSPVWAERLQTLLEKTQDTSVARGFLPHEYDWAGGYLQHLARGQGLLCAQRLSALHRCLWLDGSSQNLRCTDAAESEPLAAVEPRAPKGRELVGLVFADFAGFSKLTDETLPLFWREIMGGIGRLIDKYGEDILLRRTWGDALHVVTRDAATAAALSVDIQHFIDLRRSKQDALAVLELRLSAHFAPAFEQHNPVEDSRTYFGTPLSYAARIEPVAPPGMVFVTEAFAARLTLERPDAYALEYAGELELAKRFGRYRLYSLRAI